MSRASRAGLASILLAAGALGCAGTGGPPLESLGQREFLEEAARRSADEVGLGREVAIERPDVRAFVERTVEDHARIQREAREALRETQTGAPGTAEPAPGEATSPAVRDGKVFESDYLDWVIADHEALVTAYEERSRSGEHPAVTAFAERNAPLLQKRLEEARALLIQVVSARAQPFMPPPTYPAARFMIGGR